MAICLSAPFAYLLIILTGIRCLRWRGRRSFRLGHKAILVVVSAAPAHQTVVLGHVLCDVLFRYHFQYLNCLWGQQSFDDLKSSCNSSAKRQWNKNNIPKSFSKWAYRSVPKPARIPVYSWVHWDNKAWTSRRYASRTPDPTWPIQCQPYRRIYSTVTYASPVECVLHNRRLYVWVHLDSWIYCAVSRVRSATVCHPHPCCGQK